jgi:hypothetical protein
MEGNVNDGQLYVITKSTLNVVDRTINKWKEFEDLPANKVDVFLGMILKFS